MSLSGSSLVTLLTQPRSILLVGASANPKSYSARPLDFLQRYGFAGRIQVVNPQHRELGGIACVPRIEDVEPNSAEVAMILLPASQVAEAAESLADIGVRAATAIAGGFGVQGGLREDLKDRVTKLPLRLVGPNCIGFVANASSSFLTFSGVMRESRPPWGSIGLVTQSGAMGNALLASLIERGAGISHWVSTGDEVDVGAFEMVAGLLDQPDVQAIGVFLEGIGDREWLGAVRSAIAATGKRVFLIKAGRTDAGKFAAAGHTGRVVGSSEASLAVLRDCGIRIVGSVAEMADALVTSDIIGRLPGPRTAIVSVSGGLGVIGADSVKESARLSMADVRLDSGLSGLLGGRVHEVTNPLDVGSTPSPEFAGWVRGFSASPTCDAVIMVQSRLLNDTDELVAALVAEGPPPGPVAFVPFTEAEPVPAAAIRKLAAHRVAVLPTVERAVAAFDLLADDVAAPEPEVSAHEGKDEHLGGLVSTSRLLPQLAWARFEAVSTLDDAEQALSRFGGRAVVKAAGEKLHHRTEAGAVRTGVTEATLPEAFAVVRTAAEQAGDSVIVQEQLRGGVEVMVSAFDDPEVGPIAFVRPGGVMTELIRDQAVLWSGSSGEERLASLRGSVVGRLLCGYRGGKHYDIEALNGLVSQLLAAVGSGTREFIELNPVFVFEQSLGVVDALSR